MFLCPANICTSPVKLVYTAEKKSTCPDWKVTCPVGQVTTKLTKVYVPLDKSYMPRACWHTLMSSPALVCFSMACGNLWNYNGIHLLLGIHNELKLLDLRIIYDLLRASCHWSLHYWFHMSVTCTYCRMYTQHWCHIHLGMCLYFIPALLY